MFLRSVRLLQHAAGSDRLPEGGMQMYFKWHERDEALPFSLPLCRLVNYCKPIVNSLLIFFKKSLDSLAS